MEDPKFTITEFHPDGSVSGEIVFKVDNDLDELESGEWAVVYQTLYGIGVNKFGEKQSGTHTLVEHKNPNDEAQRFYPLRSAPVRLATSASFEDFEFDEYRVAEVDAEQVPDTVFDKVSIEHIVANEEYTLKAQLVRKSDGEILGETQRLSLIHI